jgi:hypothetical protein
MIEKRKYKRVINGAKVAYKVMGVKGEYGMSTLDMGAGGLRLPLREKIKTGTLLELSISLEDGKEPFFGLVKVAWQNPTTEKQGQP